jgi:hypothetical protein
MDRRSVHRVDVAQAKTARPFSLQEIEAPSCAVSRQPNGVLPMPATKADIEQLRSILRHYKSGALMGHREQGLADALDRAIVLLEENEAPTVTKWILAALHASVRKAPVDNMWFVVDRDLYAFAMQQLEDIYGPTTEHGK